MTSSGEIQCYWSDLLFSSIINYSSPKMHLILRGTYIRDGLNLFNLLNKLRFEPQFFVSCNYNFGTFIAKRKYCD